ncbi:MAG TPA: saccharopine dehydrogenase family protein [Caulobacteraceae bacterium]|nr:saccharopine dehydrogenase family protein [Caulobacteraceae bacterium]
MKHVVVVGAGHIGSTISALLARTGDYTVTLVDRSAERLAQLDRRRGVETAALDVADTAALRKTLGGAFAVISAAPYHLTAGIAEAARSLGIHYLDLTEDVVSTRRVKALAAGAPSALIPQCGLAPGFISIVAADLTRGFDELHDVRLRVGALPKYPSNALNYNLTWSTEGVINEYCEPCEAIVEGQLRQTRPLEECESLALDGVTYEAFNTSGGLGTLCETLAGKARNVNYRTIRYPGHAAIMKTLLNDLRLRDRRDVLKDILESALPVTMQDVVIVFVTVSGMKGDRLVQETYANRIYATNIDGEPVSAIQITTASAACAVLDLLAEGALPQSGLVRQEDIALRDFLANRFGRAYASEGAEAPGAVVEADVLETLA